MGGVLLGGTVPPRDEPSYPAGPLSMSKCSLQTSVTETVVDSLVSGGISDQFDVP